MITNNEVRKSEKQCSDRETNKVQEKDSKNNWEYNIVFSLLAFLCLILLIFMARKFGPRINLPEISSHAGAGMIFIFGLLSGLHCVGMCGSFIIGYTTEDEKQKRSAFRSHLLYGTGKILSYTLFGAVFGFVGSIFRITPLVSGISISVAGIFLILYGLKMLNIFSALKSIRFKMKDSYTRFTDVKRKKNNSPLFIGFFSGFILGCGPLQMMYIMAAGNGNILEGAKFLAIFGAGTLPALFGFGLLARILSGKMTSHFIRASGLILVFLGIMMLNRGILKAATIDAVKTIQPACEYCKKIENN